MILADTEVLIDYLAGVQPAVNQIASYSDAEQLQTTAITCFEVLSAQDAAPSLPMPANAAAAFRCARLLESRAADGKRGDAVRQLLASVEVLPLDRAAAERAADVRRKLDRKGQPIGMGDSLIAGIALVRGLPLFTRNRNHFERVPGLNLVEGAEESIS